MNPFPAFVLLLIMGACYRAVTLASVAPLWALPLGLGLGGLLLIRAGR